MRTTWPFWAVVPLKAFRGAKQRLAEVLEPAARAELARVMCEDVLGALNASRPVVAGVIVVTADPEAATLARRYGATVLEEPDPAGLNPSIARAAGYIGADPDAGMLVVPGDLPHVSPDAVKMAAGLVHDRQTVALVRASADGGTNLLACRPAGAIAPRFGPGSFNAHCRAALDAGLTPMEIAGGFHLARDLDRPIDLAVFLGLATRTRTHAYLSGLMDAPVFAPVRTAR